MGDHHLHGHHHHGHHHHGHHHHGHHSASLTKALTVSIVLNVGFVIAEAIGAWAAGSMALLADAGHNLSDSLGLILAWGAQHLAEKTPTKRHTYGLRRSTIFAAVINSFLLLFALGALAWEAVGRLQDPEPVASHLVIAVAACGILINGFTAWLLSREDQRDLNARAAYLHLLADAVISAVVVGAGILMLMSGWYWVDPVISIIISLIIARSSFSVLMEGVWLSLDAVPRHIEFDALTKLLFELPGVTQVHDLHVWATGTRSTALTVHLVRQSLDDNNSFLAHARALLHERFHIDHVTIQIEQEDSLRSCEGCPPPL